MPRGSEARAPQRDATATRSLSTTTRKAMWLRRPSTHVRTHAHTHMGEAATLTPKLKFRSFNAIPVKIPMTVL